MPINNKFTGKVLVVAETANDLSGSLRINFPIDLNSSVIVRSESYDDILSNLTVQYSDVSDLPSSVQTSFSHDLDSSVGVRPHNKMSGLVEVVPPPIISAAFNPVEDTYAREDMPKLNYGHDQDQFVGVTWGGDRYRTYLRFDISSLPKNKIVKSAKLVLSLLNSRPAFPIGIYEVPLGEVWTEYGLTWDSQPNVGTLIKTYDSGAYYGKTEIDLTSYVSEWYGGKRSHNGFILKALDETVLGSYKQYGTRENSDATLRPTLLIEYYDPTIYSYKRDDLKSSVFVYALGESQLDSSVVVSGYVGDSEIEGSLTVRDPFAPVSDDLSSSVGVTRDYLPSSVYVPDGSYIDGSVVPRVESASDLEGTVIVNRTETVGNVYVRPYADLDSSVFTKALGENDLTSNVIVNAPERQGSVYVRYYDDLQGSVIPRPFKDADIYSSVAVNMPELPSSVVVNPYADLGGSVKVKQLLSEEIDGSVIVSAPERPGSIYVRFYDDLDSSVQPRIKEGSDLYSSIFVVSDFIKSSILVRNTADTDLDASLKVRREDFAEIDGSVVPRVKQDGDLNSEVSVRRDLDADLPSAVIPRVVGAYDVPTSVKVEYASNLPSSVVVRVTEYVDLGSQVGVRVETYDEIPGSVIKRVEVSDDLDGSVTVRVRKNSDLDSSVKVRAETSKDLSSCVTVRTLSASDIDCYVEVGGDIGYVFIM